MKLQRLRIAGEQRQHAQAIDIRTQGSLKSKIFKRTYVIHLLVVYQCTKFQECIPNYDAIFVTSGGRTHTVMLDDVVMDTTTGPSHKNGR